MEECYAILKDYIINVLPDYITPLETEDCSLPLFTEKNIHFGSVDITRYDVPVLCAVIPDNQTVDAGTIHEWVENSRYTIAFICQKAKHELLTARMCRYAKALKNALMNDYTLSGRIEGNEINNINFFDDAGTIEKQMTISEVQVTLLTNNIYEI